MSNISLSVDGIMVRAAPISWKTDIKGGQVLFGQETGVFDDGSQKMMIDASHQDSGPHSSSFLQRIAMFVAIVGTRFAGKSSIEDYLVASKGFTPVRIIQSTSNDIGEFEEALEVCDQHMY